MRESSIGILRLAVSRGEDQNKEQMIEVANPEDHQIVVFQHHDRPHEHVHVYINRAPIGWR
jgi:hypothetical protein